MILFACRASYIKKKTNGKKLSSNTYLTEAEPFLKQFAERNLKNKKLVGAAGVDIDVDDFLALQQGGEDEYISEGDHSPAATTPAPAAPAVKAQGMLVFFPGTYHRTLISVPVCRALRRELRKEFNPFFRCA